MIDVAPTAAVSIGATVPIAALGRQTFEPGTGMNPISPGPSLAVDLGVLLAGVVLPHVRFERAWMSCTDYDISCRAVNDAASFGLRVTSDGRFRVFGDLGIGLRRLTTDPTPPRIRDLALYELAGVLENRTEVREGSQDIRWTGIDTLRLAVGSAYALRDELAIEVQLDCAMGSFRHVRTASSPGAANLDPGTSIGFEADVRDDAHKAYVIFGLTLAVRGFLPIR
jgi:hypothetical protein